MSKTPQVVKLNLRLPATLHKRLAQTAKQNNVSLNTEIINQLQGHQSAQVALFTGLLKNAVEELTAKMTEAGVPPPVSKQADAVLYALVKAGKITAEDAFAAGLGRLPQEPPD